MSHKVWIHFQIRSHGRWDVILQSELLLGADPVEIVVFAFLACFVALNPNPQFLKVCNSWIPSLLSGRAGSHWSEAVSECDCSYEEGSQQDTVYDETIIGHMCKNALTRHGASINCES